VLALETRWQEQVDFKLLVAGLLDHWPDLEMTAALFYAFMVFGF
jgi:hypothetical protein